MHYSRSGYIVAKIGRVEHEPSPMAEIDSGVHTMQLISAATVLLKELPKSVSIEAYFNFFNLAFPTLGDEKQE